MQCRAAMIRRSTFGLALLSLSTIFGSIAACSNETIIQAAPTPDAAAAETPDADAPDADVPDTAPPKPLPKLAFPEVQSRGGPTIKTPTVIPIVYSGDALATSITGFTTKIGASQYWKDLGAQYGVGPMTAGTTITLTEAAPTTITSDAIETWLIGKLSGATPEFGVPDANTLYSIYYPASTTITMDGAGELGQSCQGYGGYHSEVTVGTTHVGYAVLPRCSDIDDLTVSASHEYFEWATDPFPMSKPAYNKLDAAHWAWQVVMIGELGDLCTYLDRENLRPAEIGFLVQREWSNTASLAGKYPCAPAKTAPYLQVIPTAEDLVDVPDYGSPNHSATITTKAISIKAGGSRTVDAIVYSDQAGTPLVPMRALSHADFGGTGKPSGFSYSLSEDRVKVGQRVQITIDAPKAPGYDILVMTSYTGPDSAHYWPVLVVTDDFAGARAPGQPPPEAIAKLRNLFGTRAPQGRPSTKLGIPRARR